MQSAWCLVTELALPHCKHCMPGAGFEGRRACLYGSISSMEGWSPADATEAEALGMLVGSARPCSTFDSTSGMGRAAPMCTCVHQRTLHEAASTAKGCRYALCSGNICSLMVQAGAWAFHERFLLTQDLLHALGSTGWSHQGPCS